ncbi:MAG TPA: murein biosynthesis integral membrane protein MurJ [Candidatus Polarisedimenticolaceae bacterium]|nr:murein biosynthesis integral membrane protein MurJ [Candidatus Polarisedimenticolaceae bacterium]
MSATPPSLLRSAGSISVATAMSRVLGLARDQVQSYYFGAGFVTDAFLAAFRIPNLMRDLFAEGALSSAFVPTFTTVRTKDGEEAAWTLARRVMSVLLVLLGVLSLLIFFGAPAIMHVYAAGFSPEKLDLAIRMTRILSPFLLAVALASVAMGVLNTFGRFFVPALAPASLNVAAILGMIALPPLLVHGGWHPGLSLAIGAMAGGLLQFGVQLPGLYALGFRFRWDWRPKDPGVVRIAKLMLPATIGQAATQINFLVDTWLASRYGNGPITWLSLAFRLIQLPIGLFGVALGMANLARVSRDAAQGDHEGLRTNLASALRAAALLALPATAGLVALREPIIRLLFEHGRFDAHSTQGTAAALLCYALGLYAYAVTKIQVPTFYALGDTRLPVIGSTSAVAAKLAANGLFVLILPAVGLDPFLGLALSTSIAAWTNFSILGMGLRRRAGALEGRGVVRATVSMALLSAIMGIACYALHAGLSHLVPGESVPRAAFKLAAAVAAGAVITLAGAHVLGVPEARDIARRLTAVAKRGRRA